jgi:hypothetical protein
MQKFVILTFVLFNILVTQSRPISKRFNIASFLELWDLRRDWEISIKKKENYFKNSGNKKNL